MARNRISETQITEQFLQLAGEMQFKMTSIGQDNLPRNRFFTITGKYAGNPAEFKYVGVDVIGAYVAAIKGMNQRKYWPDALTITQIVEKDRRREMIR